MDSTEGTSTAPEAAPAAPPIAPQAAQPAPPGMPQYAPPMPPYYLPPANQFWNRMMREKDRTAGLALGILGSCLIFISSLVGWKKGEDYYDYMRGAPKSTTFYAPLLMLGLALLAGILLAYLWREHSAGAIFSIIVSGGVCAVGFGFAVAQIIAAEPGSSGIIGTGAYLGLAGGLLALLGSLLLLSGRKAGLR